MDRGPASGGAVLDAKSRVNWLRFGDCNTKFFNTMTLVRRRCNKVEMFKNGEGD